MKKFITLFAVLGMVLALAPAAQAALTTGMSSVLRQINDTPEWSNLDDGYGGQGAYVGDGAYALGNFDLLDTNANVGGATGYFSSRNVLGRGYNAADVLTGGVADFLAGAQYVAVDDQYDKYKQLPQTPLSDYATYQITFDQPGTFYLLADSRGGFNTTGYTDTGVDIGYSQWGLSFNVWSQDVVASQTVTTPGFGGSVEPIGFAFVPDPPPTGMLMIVK